MVPVVKVRMMTVIRVYRKESEACSLLTVVELNSVLRTLNTESLTLI